MKKEGKETTTAKETGKEKEQESIGRTGIQTVILGKEKEKDTKKEKEKE